jgi:peroxiredoxin
LVSLNTPLCNFGLKAEPFSLLGIDNKLWTLDKAKGENGLLIMFICNHCPYVKAILPRLINDLSELKKYGINSIAISSNDVVNYPQDSFEEMKKLSVLHNFTFPYIFDESQSIAKSYNAICTPDFFGYNKELQLQYRGRFDESKKLAAASDVRRDLFEAMKLVAETGRGPEKQIPSMGCSIKWRAA